MKLRLFWCLFVFMGLTQLAMAGDLATFANLGFSENSEYFMFSQFGVDSATGKPWAETSTVQVAGNKYVPGGLRKSVYGTALQPGQDPVGALYAILAESAPLSAKHRINHLLQGRLLYLLMNGDSVKSVLEFRDFNTGAAYAVRLLQNSSGVADKIKAAFHLLIQITLKDGKVREYSVGLPGYFREGVMEYRIKQILLSPNEKNLVVVMEKDLYAAKGKSVRYMVETLKL